MILNDYEPELPHLGSTTAKALGVRGEASGRVMPKINALILQSVSGHWGVLDDEPLRAIACRRV
jgi:hypothetical protein